jgi:hypothetical protein
VLAPLVGCHRGPPPAPPAPPLPALGLIAVRDLTPRRGAPAHIDVDALGAAVRARLLATGQFATPGDGPDAGAGVFTRARLEVGIDGAEVEDRGLARARVSLQLETRPSGAPGAIDERLEGGGEEPYATGHVGHGSAGGHRDAGAPPAKDLIYGRLVERLADDLVDGFAARRRLRAAGPSALHAALAPDAGDLRLEAIRVIGERHVTSESDALLALLNDPDETTRDAALGALIALGDRRAVTELTRTRSLRDRREMSKIIEAISILGGQEADDYLSFIAGSHDDDDIRAEAAAARARLQRRRADASANPP